jgi:hypothetical protein
VRSSSALCEIAVQLKPKEIQLHLNLGGYIVRRRHTIKGLKQARKVESRRAPLLPFFGRKHILNRELGKLRDRILEGLGK